MTPPGNERLDRIRAYLAGSVTVTTPRDAATVVLLRDSAAGPEVYLLRRPATMAFGAGMHVFPGGSVDKGDAEGNFGWEGPAPRRWAETFSCSEPLARAMVCAAVRETFEESGVLLAAAPDGELVRGTTGDEWENDRVDLISGALSFGDFLSRRSLVLRADLLRAWSHWITPEWSPRRFDTRFFVAALPAGQQTRNLGGEADKVAWMPVAQAFADYREGTLEMMVATGSTLRDLAAHDDVLSILRAERVVTPILIRPVADGAEVQLVYDTSERSVPTSELVRPVDRRATSGT